ncbi:ferrous iron transporter B [Aestuariicella hydrocarbonica]|uniref:Fe(2+) transporter FeoB n=1 Tax=Pseudomaricurvus hydrocarbonicus TaxID=1470433 RepID=A0A9E5JRL7_9GAMM|nr:ferrous iron transporter B [Aestuariicella hydrocarbonica]NHO65433.1 ferrous iron transporter B [Aestuariicella hydrocarbonica]
MSDFIRFALVGNPNCGKTSIFNHLTGARAKVANYPGVTVERRLGPITGISENVELVDLPGTYSLHVSSLDEKVARDMILGQLAGEAPPDVLVAVVDATNLRLGLRLVLELEKLGRPMMLALNQVDAAKRRGIKIDTEGLAAAIGIPVIETVALRRQGIAALKDAIAQAAELHKGRTTQVISDDQAQRTESVESLYHRIEGLMNANVEIPADRTNWQDRLDRLVMHPVAGMALLFVVLLTVFQAVFAWATPAVDLIDGGFTGLGELVATTLPDGILKNFIVDGLIAGVGGVVVFLPQIIILFFFILLMEDSGYLTRAAFLLDRPMRGVGLSGRSFIPLLSSFACAVPGIMSTRTVPDPRERAIAIMVAPLMTCSARLPVYTLIIAAFIPNDTVFGFFNLQGLTLFALYIAGIVSAALVAWVLRLRNTREEYPLLLELPAFRWPSAYHLFMGLRERTWVFLRRVGTIILALSVVLWALSTFPAPPVGAVGPAIEYSFAGQIGRFMQPLFEPMGFTWQMCIALIPAMAAREVAVSALATVYAVGGDSVEMALGQTLGSSWGLPVALAYLAWFVYAPQCLATIAVVRRETNSAAATTFFTVYLFGLAYLAAVLTYQIATALLG